jgi:hypothetical protein
MTETVTATSPLISGLGRVHFSIDRIKPHRNPFIATTIVDGSSLCIHGKEASRTTPEGPESALDGVGEPGAMFGPLEL